MVVIGALGTAKNQRKSQNTNNRSIHPGEFSTKLSQGGQVAMKKKSPP
jgi:hypothetical protein